MGSRSTSKNSTTNNVTNYSLQGVETSGAVVAGNNNTVYSTDHGAINSALDFAKNQSSAAYGFGESALEENSKVVNASLKTNAAIAEDALKQGFGFGESALESNNEALKRSIDFSSEALKSNSEALNNSFGFGELAIESNNEVIKQGFGFADSLVQQNTANSGAATMAMKELAKSVSTGGASDVADQSLKAVYTIGGVSVAVVLGLLFMQGAK